MWKVGLGLAVTAMVLGGAARADAEEPATEPVVAPVTPPAPTPVAAPVTPPAPTPAAAPVTPPAPTPVADPCPPVIDVAAEQRAFEREMQLFTRRWEVTQRLVAEREARAFADAQARYAKFAHFTKKLADEAAAEAERQFDAAVALFMKKRELTRTLSTAPNAAVPAAAPAPVFR
jgi:type IV secretory pathway VirB10-like protein